MKIAVLVYHKNAAALYPKEWIETFKHSILKQTFTDYEIFEINYGDDDFRIFEKSHFAKKKFSNFAECVNEMFTTILKDIDVTAFANCNVDDVYDFSRFEKQIKYIEAGYDLVSSNFYLFRQDKNKRDTEHYFDKLDIRKELAKDHNVICHPVLMWSRKYVLNNRYIPSQIPFEDMLLWKRTMWEYNFVILPEFLCGHRLHTKSIGHNLKET